RYAAAPNNNVANKRLTSFLCPSDTAKYWNSNVAFTMHNYVLNTGNSNFYQTNTPVGCTGGDTIGTNGCVVYGQAPLRWSEDPAALAAGGDSSPVDYTGGDPNQGMMGRPRAIADISDGTSNPLCVSEILQAPRGADDIRGFTWWGGSAGFVTYQTPNNP